MNRINRRVFLRRLATGAGALAFSQFLAGCQKAETEQPLETQIERTATEEPRQTAPQATETKEAPEGRSKQGPVKTDVDLAVARGGDPEEMVRRAVEALGGMERFVSKGDHVVLKPNICIAYHTYEYAATTNPWVVGALVKMAFEARAKKVRVMDFPFGGSAEEAYVKSGIREQVEAAGGEMVLMQPLQFIKTDIPNAVALQYTELFEEALKADVLINIPIAKNHNLCKLTLGMKNLMGLVANRGIIHRDMGEKLTDLYTLVRPALTVVDAVRILTMYGPTGGDLSNVKQMDTIIASADIVAADAYAAQTLFDTNPDDIVYIAAGAARGIGRKDFENLKVAEIAL